MTTIELGAPDDAELAPFALERLVAWFGLSPFERDVLLLAAGVELDAGFAALVATIRGERADPAPTFGLALAGLPGAHWTALGPDAPLRAWRLVELGAGGLTTAPVRIDERVLHFLAGAGQPDERLAGLTERLATPAAAGPTHEAVADRLAAAIAGAADPAPGASRTVQLTGGDPDARAAVAALAADRLGRTALRLDAADLPAAATDRHALARLLARDALLGDALLLIDGQPDPADGARIAAFARSFELPLVAGADEPLAALAGRGPIVEVDRPSLDERLAAWTAALGEQAATLDGAIGRIAGQFELDGPALRTAALEAARLDGAPPDALEAAIWDACRALARPRMDGLAQRIEALAGWDDIVLPDLQRKTLREIAVHVRHRHRVHDEWGFAARSARGLGIAALFAGPSGTGKTMAAEVLARELRLDLYRIDLASVVSKYIGETEKNLKRLFDAAEGSGAILLFDEADALFGKRSEVKDSHDRYANIEVSYLLQRMEAYRGLAVLTTNLREAIDPAFLRRIRFIVTFPFPDAEHRAAIWRRIFPSRTPTDALDPERLAQLNLAGGHIRNVALGAAFRAAERGGAVSMADVAEAARTEYAKLARPLSDAETRGWA